MKRVTNLIVAKDVASGDGFVDIIKADGSVLLPGETIGDTDQISIRQELALSDVRVSLPIRGLRVRKFTGGSYVAAVSQVQTIDPVSVLNNTKYLLRVSIISQDQVDPVRQSFEVETDSATTATKLVTLLKDKLNDAAVLLPITATGTSTLILTSDAPDNIVNHSVPLDVSAVRFTVGLDDGWDSGATNVETTAPDPGSGNFNQMRILEHQTKGYSGYLNRVQYQDDPTFFTTLGTNYDIYVIEAGSQVEQQSGINETLQVVYIAIPAAPANFLQGAFETLLNGYLGSTPASPNPVNL